jgi:hypothetical protein
MEIHSLKIKFFELHEVMHNYFDNRVNKKEEVNLANIYCEQNFECS